MSVALKRAEEAHGHLCPFLALGVRTALIGIRELGAKGAKEDLHVTLMLQNPASYPCLIDGIQVTTECTIGNKKLRFMNSSGIAAKFELPNKEPVTVAVKPASFDTLIGTMNKVMSGNATSEEFQQLVKLVVSIPEKELFIIRKK
jgi:formylmethanofuran dehydrogenase subunit E